MHKSSMIAQELAPWEGGGGGWEKEGERRGILSSYEYRDLYRQ